MAKIVLIGVSSRAQQDKIEDVFREYSKKIVKITDVVLGLISNVDDLNREIERTKLSEDDLIVLVVLSGGTRNLIIESMKHVNRAILLVNPKQNAWASVLHAQYILRSMDKKMLVYLGEPQQINWEKVTAILNAWKRITGWRRQKVVLLGVDSRYIKNERYNLENLNKYFGLGVVTVSLEEFIKKVQDSVPNLEVLKFIDETPREVDDKNSIIKIAKMFTAVSDLLEGHLAGGIRCFPIIMRLQVTPCVVVALFIAKGKLLGCEADLPGLVTMMFARAVADIDPFIANPEFIDGDKLVLAHCTASYKLLDNVILRKHFETGLPHAVQGEFREGYVTILKISPDFSKIFAVEGRIISGKAFSNEFCRNQMIIKLEEELPSDFFDGAYAHHLVVIYGKNKDVILSLAKLFGFGIQFVRKGI